MTGELLAAGPDAPVRRWPLAALLVVVLAGAVGWAVDGQLREREVHALLERVTTGQDAVAYADRRVGATVLYATPQLYSASTPRAVRESLRQLVQDAAAGQVARLDGAAADVERLRVLPWHRDARRARAAYSRYLKAQADQLGDVARDADALYASRPDLDRARVGARAALLQATADASARRRVRDMLAGDEGS